MAILSYDDKRSIGEYGADQKGMISGLYNRSGFAPASQLAKAEQQRRDLDCAARKHQRTEKPIRPKMKRISRQARLEFEKAEAQRRFRECCAAMKS